MDSLKLWIYRLMNLSYCMFLLVIIGLQLQYYVPVLMSDENFDRTLAQSRKLFIDFRMDYALGKMLASDQRAKLYDPPSQFIQFTKTIQPLPPGQIGFICYMPFFYLLMLPLSSLSVHQALLVWLCSSMALGIAGLTLLGKRSGLSVNQIMLVLLGTLSCEPAIYALTLGQTSWYFVAFLSFFFLGILGRFELVAIIAGVLSLIKMQYGLLTIVITLLQRRWKLLAGVAVISIILNAMTAPYIGWSDILHYPTNVNAWSQRQDLDFGFMSRTLISLRAPLVCYLPWDLANILTRVQALIGLGFITSIWWRTPKGNQAALRWAIAMTIVLGLLTSPHSHIYDCLLLCIAAMITLPTIDLGKIVKLQPLCLQMWCLLMYFFPAASLTYVSYYKIFSPCDFLGFIFLEALMAIAGVFCFLNTLRPEAETQGNQEKS